MSEKLGLMHVWNVSVNTVCCNIMIKGLYYNSWSSSTDKDDASTFLLDVIWLVCF